MLKQLNRVKFIDSLNYLPMALSANSKAVELTEMKKEFFPHLFNTEENAEYEGSMSEVSYYSPNDMMTSVRRDFLRWCKGNKPRVFDVKKN